MSTKPVLAAVALVVLGVVAWLQVPRDEPLAGEMASPIEIQFTGVEVEAQAPRRLYLLWLLTDGGVPSLAKWVVLR